MRRVLIVCDQPGWAFDAIAQALVKYNDRPGLNFDVMYLKGNRPLLEATHRNYDYFFVMHWSMLASLSATWLERIFGNKKPATVTRISRRYDFLDPARTLVGIHSHVEWDGRRSTPQTHVLPPKKLVRFLNKYKAVNAVSHRLFNLFKRAGLNNAHYTANGVDSDVFKPLSGLSTDGSLRVGYAGNKRHEWARGITEYIEPLGKLPWVDLRLALPADGHRVPHAEMPGFYNQLDVYLCTSRAEGFSLAVLEASACGRPLVTTRVGGCEDLIIDGENGFFVERDLADIVEKLRTLHDDRELLRTMGRRNREIVEEKWSWKIRAKDWLDFIEDNIC